MADPNMSGHGPPPQATGNIPDEAPSAPRNPSSTFMRAVLPVTFPLALPLPAPRASSKVHSDVSPPETESATPKDGMLSHGSSVSISSQSLGSSEGGIPIAGEKPSLSMKSLPSLARRGYPIEVSHLSYGVIISSWVPQVAQSILPAAPIAPLHHTHPRGIATPEEPKEDATLADEESGCLGGRAWSGRAPVPVPVPVTVTGAPDSVGSAPLSWSHVSGSIQQAVLPSSQVKTILKDVSFTASPGQVLAVVGSSGAGKSTVLDALAGRIRSKSLQGQILVNGQPTASRSYKRLIGYVMQDEALFAMLTPRETLMLSACLRLPSSISKREKAERVEQLLALLGLMGVADSRIGDAEIRGISGGEKRRVSIGIDLVHDPPVLLLDEPTSGLDSCAALNVVEVLRAMADQQNRTVVLSIHQPSYRILEQIDRVLLLHKGSVAFCGALPRLEASLESIGLPVPMRMNALEYAIELLQGTPDVTMELMRKAQKQAREGEGALSVCIEQSAAGGEAKELASGDAEQGEGEQRKYATSFWNEVGMLCSRNAKVMFRTKELCLVRATQIVLCALGLGTVFLHVGNSEHSIQDRMGFMAFSMAFLLTSSMEALPLFLKERQVFVRETARGAYRLSSYQVASVLVFLPFLLLLAVLFSAGSYWLVGLYPSWQAFLFFVLTVWGALITANSMVAFFAALAPDFITANSLIAGLMGGFFLFSGYFIAKNSIPVYWVWMYYLSIFKYPLEALLINEYGSDPTMVFGFFTGEQVLGSFDLLGTSKWMQIGALFGFAVVYRLLCYGALAIRGTTRQ